MRKRITSLLLTLAMLLSLLPAMGVTASAADGGNGTKENPYVVTTYKDLKEKMELTGDKYIQLGADIDTSGENSGYGLGSNEFVSAIGRSYLDLNGKKLTLKKSIIESGGANQFIRLTAGELIISDSKGSGEIFGVNKVTMRYMCLIDVVDGAKLTLNSGKLHLEFNADAGAGNATIESSGTVEINGGTVATSCPGGWDERVPYVYNQDCALHSSGEAVIKDGTFDGRVVLKAVAKASGVADNVITGGDFKKSIYIQKDKDVTEDVPLNVSIQGGTYHYTPGYRMDDGVKESDPLNNFQFATYGFTKKNYDYTYYPKADGTWYDYTAEYDMNAFASIFPKNAIISATGQEYEFIDSRFPAIPVKCEDAVYTGSSSALELAHLVNSHYNTITVTKMPDPPLTGKVYYTSGIVYDRPISIAPSGIPDDAVKAYQWQRSTDGGSTWADIDGATNSQYKPTADDMGANVRIRVKITANGYLGEIVGAAVKVSKADNNNKYPEVIQLEAVKDGAGNYTGFKITNFDSDYEYVYSTTDTPNWSANQISSATAAETGLASNTTYYVFARFKETNTHTAGSIVSKNSIMLYDYVPLDRVLLEGYGSYGKIYIKQGESVTLKLSTDPSNVNYWNKITFKERGTATGCITVDNAEIAASGENAASFSDHTIKITGVSEGRATLIASYPSATESFYGTWDVVVYNDPADALRLENVYTYADITLSENDEAELPTDLPKLLPENSGYHLEWRIVKSTTHLTQDDNITLENGKIKPRTAHTGSEKTQVELVAVKDGSTTTKLLAKTSPFYVTVTKAPTITLTGVTVAPKKVNLEKVNDTCQLSAVKEPVNATGILNWESSNTGVATVDSTGKVTAKAQGTAIITVSCGDKKATCTVTVAHTHDYTGQPWVYMDPGTHTKTCTAGDNFKAEAHTFSAWKKVDDTNHSRTCTACKMTDGSVYTETASHNWQWVVDTHATSTTAGKKHEECSDCHAKRNEGTVIPATGGGSSSGGGGGAGVTTYAITVQNSKNGAVTASHKSAAKDTAVTLTVTPDKGYVLDTLNVLDSKNKAVKLTEKNGKYTFTMPSGKVTVSAAFKAAAPASENPFTDVPSGAYYEDAVVWAVKKDITSGTSATTFNPDGSCTRAQAVTFLWRAAGSPEPKSAAMPFTDVPAGSYFEKAVLWAVENGITKGTSDTTFSPDASCTRAQIVTFLWRAGGSPAVSGNSAFSDVAADAYYAAAVAWAEKNGVTGGIGGGLFGSDNTCTRAQIVTFLHRAMK